MCVCVEKKVRCLINSFHLVQVSSFPTPALSSLLRRESVGPCLYVQHLRVRLAGEIESGDSEREGTGAEKE